MIEKVNIPVNVILTRDISNSSKCLYMFLAASPIHTPSYTDIRLVTGFSRGTISGCLKELSSKNLLSIKKSYIGNKNEYTLHDI